MWKLLRAPLASALILGRAACGAPATQTPAAEPTPAQPIETQTPAAVAFSDPVLISDTFGLSVDELHALPAG